MCWYCKKEGHLKKDCFAMKRSMGNDDDDGETAVAIEQLETGNALNVSMDVSNSDWVIGYGCTHHMTSRREWFLEFSEKDASKILLGGLSLCGDSWYWHNQSQHSWRLG